MAENTQIDPAQIDYTDADFASLKRRLINVATTEITGWDPAAQHVGNLVLSAVSWAFDIAARGQDVATVEGFITTARRRENVEQHAAQLGYTPSGRVAAKYFVTITLNTVPVNDVEIPVGWQFFTSGSQARTFESITPGLILAAADPPTATVQVEDTTGREDTQSSTNLPYQVITTTGRPLPNTIVILAADGAYTIQPNFAFSGPTDRHATIRVLSDERVEVQFGNGTLGKVPVGDIEVAYRIGGGIAGNVAPGAINQLDQLTDVLDLPVAASCTNPSAPFVVGRERETIAEIKRNAPASIRTTDRTVTKEDYETNACKVSGVARALMVTSNEMPGAIPENHGYLYVVPTDVGTPSSEVLAAVEAMITTTFPKTITFRPVVRAGVYRTITLRAVVYFDTSARVSAVVALIRSTLTDYFAPLLADLTPNTNVGFGLDYDVETPALPINELLSIIQTLAGVARVGARADDFLLNGEHLDVTLAAYEWPKLDTITIIDGRTGSQVS